MGRKRTGGGNEERRIKFDESVLRKRFTEGHTAREIAATLGCSAFSVSKALGKLGLRRPAKRRPGEGVGPKNSAWKGGRRTRPDGYVVIWTPAGERLEHQVVVERHIGRALLDDEIVHHRDRNKANNDYANLEIMSQSEHAALHMPALLAARGNHRGQHNPRAKLTLADVNKIRTSNASSRELGLQYGVHPSTIQRIKNGKGWSHE